MSKNPRSIRQLQNRANVPEVRQMLPEFFDGVHYGMVPLVATAFKRGVMHKSIEFTGAIVIVPMRHSSDTLDIKADVIPPQNTDSQLFIERALDLLDPLVPRSRLDVDLGKLAVDYMQRDIRSFGGIVAFEGNDTAGMSLMVPSAIIEDRSMPYLDAVGDVPGASQTREELSTEFTAAIVDGILRAVTNRPA